MTDQTSAPPSGGRGAAFAPVLAIPNGVTDIDFYKEALGAVEHFRLNNDDGSIHVAEFSIDGAIFHIHEITRWSGTVTPQNGKGATASIGLFVNDVHAVFNRAIAAGAILVTPVTDYDYGYRQGEFTDAFGHRWIIQCHIPASPDWKG
jgi:PhnB protein